MTVLSKPPRPDVILFDWDGTLADSFSLLRGAYDHMTDHFGSPRVDDDEILLNTRRASRDVFLSLYGERADEAAAVFYDYYRMHQSSGLGVKEGADTCVQFIAGQGIRMGVVSNMGHDPLIDSVAQFGWDKNFDVVLGAGQAARNKPAPDPLLLACERMGVDPSQSCVWYVGDTETDMMAAHDAGVVPVFIGHGARSLANCERVGITPYFTEDFDSVIEWLQK